MMLLQHHILLILTVSTTILEPCLSRSLRQKRGIMKMMMHVMWDPVRLIRYWYAYDVTKEIAKSWRKIIPTMMVLPLHPDASKTPGIAKYIHPTYGLRETDRKYVYPVNQPYHHTDAKPMDDPYSSLFLDPGKQTSSSMVAVPVPYHPFIRADYQSRNRFVNPMMPISSKEVENSPLVEWEENEATGNQPDESSPGRYLHQMMNQVPNRNNEHVVSQPFASTDSRVVFPSTLSSSESQNVKNVDEADQKHHVYLKHPIHGTNLDFTRLLSQAVQDDGREIHIVLHPVPISHTKTDQLRKHHANKTSNSVREMYPLLQNAPFSFVEQNGELKSEDPETNCTSDCLKSSKHVLSPVEETTTETPSSSNSGVTWVLQNNAVNSNQSDHIAEDSNINSFSYGSVNKQPHDQSVLSDFSINMDELKEALRHGTPVLVPFNNKKTTTYSHNSNEKRNHEEAEKMRFSKPILPTERENPANSNQRLILFMANKTPS